MRTVAGTIGQAVVLLVLASVIGLAANAYRNAHNRIPITGYVVPVGRVESGPATGPALSSAAADDPNKFQEVTLAEAYAIFNDPGARPEIGQYVFVDARNEQHYGEGHIPGAVHCDPWHLEEGEATLMSRVPGAEKIIVYCTGGTCEDSWHMCKRLIEFSIPKDRIYLFRGGWEEWYEKNHYPKEPPDAEAK